VSKKFDVIIGNPPYKQGLHMKFLDKAFNLLSDEGELICVHPSSSFISLKDANLPYAKVVEKIKNNIKSLKFFNANGVFNIGLFVPCSITHIIKNFSNNGKIVVDFTYDNISSAKFNSLNDVNMWGNRPEIFSFLSKLNDQSTILNFVLTPEQFSNFSFFIQFSDIRGNVSSDIRKLVSDDFYTIVPRDFKIVSGELINSRHAVFGFKTLFEAENFLKYLKSNFVRRILSLSKINQHILRGELKLIPWLNFNEEWTDEKLFKYFNLSKVEIDFINEMPKYY
jgi:hypothetical protein